MSVRLYFVLGLALLSVSSTSIVIRHLADFPALALAFWRMFTASGLLWGYSTINRGKPLSKTNTSLTIIAGVFLGLHFACFFWGVRNTSIANATLLAKNATLKSETFEGGGSVAVVNAVTNNDNKQASNFFPMNVVERPQGFVKDATNALLA